MAVPVVVRVEADELEELVNALSYALLSQPRRLGTVAMFVAMVRCGEEAYLLDGVADLAPQLGAAHGGVRLAFYEISPSVGSMSRFTIRMVVVSHPEGPTRTQISPSGTSKERWLTTDVSEPG